MPKRPGMCDMRTNSTNRVPLEEVVTYPQEHRQPMPQMSPAESGQAHPAPSAEQGGQQVPPPTQPDGGVE
eukprot:5918466-Prorocentrum_lima.AAC.1